MKPTLLDLPCFMRVMIAFTSGEMRTKLSEKTSIDGNRQTGSVLKHGSHLSLVSAGRNGKIHDSTG